MVKKLLSLAMALVMISTVITSCGGAPSASDNPGEVSKAPISQEGVNTGKDDSIVIAVSSDILSMDPYRYNETLTNQFMLHIYEPLMM